MSESGITYHSDDVITFVYFQGQAEVILMRKAKELNAAEDKVMVHINKE